MKRNLLLVLVVAVVISTLSVVSMIKNSNDNSFQAYASSMECNAQGDLMPEPFNDNLLAPSNETDDQMCIAQGDIKPASWEKTNN